MIDKYRYVRNLVFMFVILICFFVIGNIGYMEISAADWIYFLLLWGIFLMIMEFETQFAEWSKRN